jgi:Rieske 2Fe-2S family protein
MSTYERPPLPAGALTLPARYYTDPAHFEREMETIHCRMWLCAGRAEALPTPGRYALRQFGNADIVLLRDERGGLAAFHNVCRHRGTRLCREPEGQLAARIQCRYHGWTYRLDGTLANAPHMDQVEGFREADYPLRRVAVAEWEGHVFINVADDPPPLSEQLGPLPAKFRPWRMAELRTVGTGPTRSGPTGSSSSRTTPSASTARSPTRSCSSTRTTSAATTSRLAPPTSAAAWICARECRPSASTGPPTAAASPASRPRTGGGSTTTRSCPTCSSTCTPTTCSRSRCGREPRTAPRSSASGTSPDEVGKPGFDPRGVIDFWDLTNRQDWELSQLAQEGIGSRGYLPGPYSNREELLHALDAFVLERTGGR